MARYAVVGAGQIGQQLVQDLLARGHEVTVLRRKPEAVPGARLFVGDAKSRADVAKVTAGADAVLHCAHAPYSAARWREELPVAEVVVMDAAAERDIPVVFPESVYAFGAGLDPLEEGAALNPSTPLGEVRAGLLAARAEHPARAWSIVASDLIGPTAQAGASVAVTTVIDPVGAGRRPRVLGDPDTPHTFTAIPDLATAMIAVLDPQVERVVGQRRVLHAPSPDPVTCRELAEIAGRVSGARKSRVSRIPSSVMRVGGLISPAASELHRMLYLWERPCVLGEGALQSSGLLQSMNIEAAVELTLQRKRS